VTLDTWQARLSEHFTRLAAARRKTGWPVFALEHGLGAGDREALMRDVRACGSAPPARAVPLPWVVYAAEIGYAYSGYEYWQTFGSKTPGWQSQWRELIRDRFEAFAKVYNGAEPDGDWAHQFSIIAWPITHGILPRDLQRQLASLLYDASMSFRAETFSSAESLGLHLKSRSIGSSSRFRQFAENATLLGQIGLALLLQHDPPDHLSGVSDAVLDGDTLARIVDDLDRERDARQWLAEARSAARFRVRGLGRITLRGHAADTDQRSPRPHTAPEEDAIGLPRPRFLLREMSAGHWQVRLQVPSLAHLLERLPRAREILTRTQGRVGGPTGPLLARGRIVSESWPTVTLKEWPTAETPLLAFDGAPPELESVLQAGFRIDAKDRWLFSIGSDGQAREIATRVLHAGESYLLIQRTETRNPVSGLGIRINTMACTGVYGLRIDVPESVPDAMPDVLGVLGLEVAQTLQVWPVGLPAPDWSGDGRAEWVAGHPIMLGVRADRRIARLKLTIDDVEQTDIVPAADALIGGPVFIHMKSLRQGAHRLAVIAQTADDILDRRGVGSDERVSRGLRGQLEYVIREPRTAAAGQTGALSFRVDPSAPSLEDVWEDHIEIHAAAPGTSSIRCRLALRDLNGRELFVRTFSLPSPCDSDAWRRNVTALREVAEAAYDDAQSCSLVFDASALGRAHVIAERDFRSLRWAVRAKGTRAVLIDSQGGTQLNVSMYRCTAPALEVPLDGATAQAGIKVENEGRLLVSSRHQRNARIVVVPQQEARTFASLVVRPQVLPCGHSVGDIRAMVALAQIWEGARVGGSALARVRQLACTQALISSAFGALGGRKWQVVEAEVRNGGNLEALLEVSGHLIAPARADEGTRTLLPKKLAPLASTSEEATEAAFVSLVHWVTRDVRAASCARFALRLSNSALIACEWAKGHRPEGHIDGDEVTYFLNYLVSSQFIARAARYVVLLRGLSGEV
jgi:hypothetical protein